MQIHKVMQLLKKYYQKNRFPTVRRTSETSKDAFKILIACLISLRTRDENTEKVTEKLFKIASTPTDFIKMPLKKLEKLVYSSGYYKNKAQTIKHVAGVIQNQYGAKVPASKEELLSIKGIGPKTANIVLSFAFGKTVIPVDVNVHRVANRLGWVKEKTAEKTEKALEKILPKKYWKEVNTLFMLHGKNICKPINPLCSLCPVEKFCKNRREGRISVSK